MVQLSCIRGAATIQHAKVAGGLPVLLLAVAMSASACETVGPDDAGESPEPIGPELAVEWSELAYEIAYAEDQFLTFKGQRAIAMMHLAVHDALQAIIPRYAVYAYEANERDADPVAAAAQAAYEVIAASYPDRSADLNSLLSAWLDRVPNSPERALGIELGSASARAILELRAEDGWNLPGEYEFRDGAGQYRTTPPWEGFTLQPGFRYAQPFSFEDPAQFRPSPPPALDSPAYAEALTEVLERGDSTSTTRTPDATGYAIWWMEFSESSVGRVARRLLLERSFDLWEANRVLAHMYMGLYDGYVATWDSKYEYNHWRPYTAIRSAADDGNAETAPDGDWVPLRTTPPFPEYVSAHAAGCGAAFEVMAEAFGDATTFENTSLFAPPGIPTRSFSGFRAAAAECADSRVQLGWHFRYATEAGLELGRTVARHVLATTLAPR